nr:VP1 [Densovirinae sp.]WGZ60563.1 VP1 [Densovirinae sp.]
MLKRAAAGGDGNEKGSKQPAIEPIPRGVRLNHVTLHFTQRSWEEIGPAELKYLPLCSSPYYMFDETMFKKLSAFDQLWQSMEIHHPKARITNLIMLQDDLVNAGGTPMETTAFTQACYLMKYTPTGLPEYFKLVDVVNAENQETTDLTMLYEHTDVQPEKGVTYLRNVDGYVDFERLGIVPAKINTYAGWISDDSGTPLTPDGKGVMYPYIPPQAPDNMSLYSATMQPRARKEEIYYKPLSSSLYSRNQNHISLYKYGDECEFDIVTNMDHVKLLRHPNNDFRVRETGDKKAGTDKIYNWGQEFYWPSSNRPFFSRSSNFAEVSPIIHNKELARLKHHFLTMPPIRKANGALLKQRCSFMLEQEISITFDLQESIWSSDATDTDDEVGNTLNQKDAVLLRPNIFTDVDETQGDGALCPYGYNCDSASCLGEYDNTFKSLNEILATYLTDTSYKLFIDQTKCPTTSDSDPFYGIDYETKDDFNTGDILSNQEFQDAWKKTYKIWFEKNKPSNHMFSIAIKRPAGSPKNVILTDKKGNKYEKSFTNISDCIALSFAELTKILTELGIKCEKKPESHIKKADYYFTDRTSSILYS